MQLKLIFLSTFILLMLAGHNFSHRNNNLQVLKLSKGSPLQRAYLFGIKSDLSKKLVHAHRHLGLLHFATPSGLHLSSLTFFFFLFLKSKKKKVALLLLIGVLTLPFGHIDSFQRMILFALIRYNPWRKFGLGQSFLLTFSICSFQFFSNPMSYSLSFLFLGILILSIPNLMKFVLLMAGQFLISTWFGQSFYPLGALYGLFLSSLSFLIFPLILIEYLLNLNIFSHYWEQLIIGLDTIKGFSLPLPFTHLMPFLLVSKRLKKVALIMGVFLVISPLGDKVRPAFGGFPPKGHRELVKLKNGFKSVYDNGLRCYSRIKEDQWITHCYK